MSECSRLENTNLAPLDFISEENTCEIERSLSGLICPPI